MEGKTTGAYQPLRENIAVDPPQETRYRNDVSGETPEEIHARLIALRHRQAMEDPGVRLVAGSA